MDGAAVGPPAAPPLGDDKSLSLSPSFSPDGKRVLFSSNRDSQDGKRMSIWWVPADGSAAPARLTAGDGMRPVAFARLPAAAAAVLREPSGQPPRAAAVRDARARAAPSATGGTDLAQTGWQPHVSPAADARPVRRPGRPGRRGHPGPADAIRRHLYTIPDNGGRAVELNHSADFDDFDPSWSKDGSRIAFASNRPRKAAGGKGGGTGGARRRRRLQHLDARLSPTPTAPPN